MNLPITTRVAKARGGACSPAKQLRKAKSTKINKRNPNAKETPKGVTYGLHDSSKSCLGKPCGPAKTPSPAKQLKRSTKVALKAAKTAIKGRKAVDEGKDKKATRLLKKAARQENRSIRIEERESDYDLKRKGFNNMSRDGIA